MMGNFGSISHLRLGFGFMVCLMFMVLGYFVLYEMGPQTVPVFEPTTSSRVNKTGVNFQGIIGKANYLLEKIGIRDNTGDDKEQAVKETHPESSKTQESAIDKDFLQNIQWFLRNLSDVDRSKDEYAREKVYRHDDQYLKYMRCPNTVRRKMLTMKEMKNIYIPDMPLLMWNEHINKDDYKRLQDFKGINGWKDMAYDVIASGLKMLDSPNNQYLFDDRVIDGQLPKDNSSCIRCAVIGNGGMMNGSKMGKEIDANDYVFRVNTALTKGFEEDVGKRTSFYCFTPITLTNTLAVSGKFGFKSPPANDDVRYVFFADNKWTYQLLNAYIRNVDPPRSEDKYHRRPPKFPKRLTAENVKVVHPDFERYLKWSWVNSPHQHKDVHRPTTGAIMMLLALHTCDEVNAYGFGGSYVKFSEHYYDKTFQKHVNYANHDNNAENRLWQRLHDLGIINFYHRD
ncbi:alpha-N-acetylgalactosaminide alpha-2,6-sialyltransferase 2-like isoform X2 [Amphiura filiformis]|uniref:alpha-N-acetylgalactosaminide alpha-2,6-sialyltransferase 2-like isoform X2 n=1 Tax=Amphiura filiformis TaxID=82378 RepID=UPI003B216771